MSFRLTLPMALGLAGAIASAWILFAVLARLSDAVYLPHAIRLAGGAAILLAIPLATTGRIPQLSLRLLHASITVAGLAYFISPILIFYSLRTLPSGLVALVFSTVPLWLVLATHGAGWERKGQYLLTFIGLGVFFVGVRDDIALRGDVLLPCLALAGAVLAQVLGVWVSKRLFWLHSALDLNFWSMVLAATLHAVLGVLSHEIAAVMLWDSGYWACLAILTIGVTGLGAYFYRAELMQRQTVVALTLAMPLFALLIGWRCWEETAVNLFTLAGFALVLYVIATESLVGAPSLWMSLFLNNDKRQGDRLICVLDAFVCAVEDGAPVRVQVVNLSMGGLGFRSAKPFELGAHVVVTLPLGQDWSSITIDGRIVHAQSAPSREFPFLGGLAFRSLSTHRRQCLVEFLARLSKAEDDVASHAQTG